MVLEWLRPRAADHLNVAIKLLHHFSRDAPGDFTVHALTQCWRRIVLLI
jgi:hypothetical protein